jgi:hypothetical protein
VPASSPVEALRLHPLIRARLGPVDMRCVSVLRVQDGLIVDLLLRNRPARSPVIDRG